MKLIAHRGLTKGPDIDLENRPEQILQSLARGFDCEIDLRVINNELFLGHDQADYLIDAEFLKKPGLWIHAKNLEAFDFLVNTRYNYFWHQTDDYTLTAHGLIWAYPGKELTIRSVMVMPEWQDETLANTLNVDCYAICSDYVAQIKDLHDSSI